MSIDIIIINHVGKGFLTLGWVNIVRLVIKHFQSPSSGTCQASLHKILSSAWLTPTRTLQIQYMHACTHTHTNSLMAPGTSIRVGCRHTCRSRILLDLDPARTYGQPQIVIYGVFEGAMPCSEQGAKDCCCKQLFLYIASACAQQKAKASALTSNTLLFQ
jgi:hypothetical protein